MKQVIRSLIALLVLATLVILLIPPRLAAQHRSYSHSYRSHGSGSYSHRTYTSRSYHHRTYTPRAYSRRTYGPPGYHTPRQRAHTYHAHRPHARAAKVQVHHTSQQVYATTGARDHRGRLRRSSGAKGRFMRQTGHPHGWAGHVIDHRVPLACGGADAPSNMQWQTTGEARSKDRVERHGCSRR
jgi:hypothetical protein